ncbi:MAG TPA: hypothetical protein VLN46_04580 [Gillisia sp.]|nr:hypothetical protein [Gillisia sp.]
MKTNRFKFRPAGLLLTAVIMGTTTLFMSCEPETEELQVAEMQTTLEMENKKGMSATLNKELAALRAYVAPYHNYEKALEDGYVVDITGYRTMMGHHYLKPEYLDAQFNLVQPEVLMYAPGPNGKMRLVGVEYATIIEDMNNPPPAPEGFTGNSDVWAINTEFNVWTLHVWVGLDNPNGIFTMHNPRLP